jgi:hypothetical protein
MSSRVSCWNVESAYSKLSCTVVMEEGRKTGLCELWSTSRGGDKEGQIFEHYSKLRRRTTICQKKCCISNALDGFVDVIVWEDDVEDKDDRTGWRTRIVRGSVSSTRGLWPTMTARGQSIGISIGMLPQTLIMSSLDQLSRRGARI